MIDASERNHGSCIGELCQSGTLVGHKSSDHCRQTENGLLYDYKSISAVRRSQIVEEGAGDG